MLISGIKVMEQTALQAEIRTPGLLVVVVQAGTRIRALLVAVAQAGTRTPALLLAIAQAGTRTLVLLVMTMAVIIRVMDAGIAAMAPGIGLITDIGTQVTVVTTGHHISAMGTGTTAVLITTVVLLGIMFPMKLGRVPTHIDRAYRPILA